MVQSVELLLDGVLDAAVRAEWARLSAAGLPSQADHRGPTNAPHVTLGVASRIDDAAESALADVVLPAEVRLGGLLVFPGERAVLSRAVVVSAELLGAHESVARALAGCPGVPDTARRDRWTPHVTLARRLTTQQLADALGTLTGVPRELIGTARSLRRWDAERREAWDVVVA